MKTISLSSCLNLTSQCLLTHPGTERCSAKVTRPLGRSALCRHAFPCAHNAPVPTGLPCMETVKITFLPKFFFFVGEEEGIGKGKMSKGWLISHGIRANCFLFLVYILGTWLLGCNVVFVHRVWVTVGFLDHLRWNLSLSLYFDICELENSV